MIKVVRITLAACIAISAIVVVIGFFTGGGSVICLIPTLLLLLLAFISVSGRCPECGKFWVYGVVYRQLLRRDVRTREVVTKVDQYGNPLAYDTERTEIKTYEILRQCEACRCESSTEVQRHRSWVGEDHTWFFLLLGGMALAAGVFSLVLSAFGMELTEKLYGAMLLLSIVFGAIAFSFYSSFLQDRTIRKLGYTDSDHRDAVFRRMAQKLGFKGTEAMMDAVRKSRNQTEPFSSVLPAEIAARKFAHDRGVHWDLAEE